MGSNPNDDTDPVYVSGSDFGTVNFDFDRSNISDDAAQMLAENVEVLNNAPAFRLE